MQAPSALPGTRRHSERDGYYRLRTGGMHTKSVLGSWSEFFCGIHFWFVCRMSGGGHVFAGIVRSTGNTGSGSLRALLPGHGHGDSAPKGTGGLGPVLGTTETLKAHLRSLKHGRRNVRSPLRALDKNIYIESKTKIHIKVGRTSSHTSEFCLLKLTFMPEASY